MPSKVDVVAVASDAGSGRALAPVVRRLVRNGTAVIGYASGPSGEILPQEAPEATTVALDDDCTPGAFGDLIAGSDARVVLTGAGAYNRLEHTARLAARHCGRPSIAVLDYWFEYAPRFQRVTDGRRVDSWPDVLCVPDDVAARGVVEAGGDPSRVVVTGSPNIEASRLWWDAYHPDRERLAHSLGVDPAAPIVAFFSEPHRANPDGRPFTGPGGLIRDDGSPLFGYTAEQMLSLVMRALADAGRRRDVRIQVIVKAHPLEWTPGLREFAARWNDGSASVSITEAAHPRELVALADAVVGMSSVTLIEAGLAARPTYSVQIGLGADAPFDPCVANRLGLATPDFDVPALETFAAAIAGGTASPPPVRPAGLRVDGATDAVAMVVNRVLAAA
ncbi:MAG: hypothetical protein AB7P99_03325 [Vicinamibacterales bacterium]